MGNDLVILTTYIINQVQERGGSPIRTQLMKLLYLLDLEFYRRYTRTVTQLSWKYHHHGPYAIEVEKVLEKLPDIDETEFVSRAGRKGYAYISESDMDDSERQLVSMFGYPVKQVLDRVLDRWALKDWWTLLDYVYFETEPMQGARRGDLLDFSTVDRDEAIIPPLPKVEFPQGKLTALRRRLAEARPKRKRVRIPTPPPYDQVYFDALRTMDEEDMRPAYIARGHPVEGPQE